MKSKSLRPTPPDCANFQPPSYPLPGTWSLGEDPQLVSAQYVLTKKGHWVLWEAYRGKRNKRLPNLYLCRLPANLEGKELGELTAGFYDLYTIGALGNRHDVDIYACDAQGNPLTQPFQQYSRETKPKRGAKAATKAKSSAPEPMSNPANAPQAGCDKFSDLPKFKVELSFEDLPGGYCHLWVRSYRYSFRPVPRAGSKKVARLPQQDGDGSPPDGTPGGEATGTGSGSGDED